jgi:hypothetical protein
MRAAVEWNHRGLLDLLEADHAAFGGSTRRLLGLVRRGVPYLGIGAVVRTAVVVDLAQRLRSVLFPGIEQPPLLPGKS